MVKILYKAGDRYGPYSHLMSSVRFGAQQETSENSLEDSVVEEIETNSILFQGVGKGRLIGDLTKTAIDVKDKGQRLGADIAVVNFVGVDPLVVGRKEYNGEAKVTYYRHGDA